MDPCTFVRITVGNLALKFPSSSSRASNSSEPTLSVHRQPPSTTMPSYFCKIKFSDFLHQIAALPVLLPPDADANCPPLLQNPALSACFNLSKSDLEKLLDKSKSKSKSNSKKKSNKKSCLKIDIYCSGRGGVASKSCGLSSGGRFVGRVSMPLELNQAELKTSSLYNGWIRIGEKKRRKGLKAELHLDLKAELDPRFVFEFEGEPECSPQVVQVQGSCRQPVFSCKFSSRHSGYWNSRSREEGSKPKVEVGVQHVTCIEDAAVFVALAAAMDLSIDACKPFSQKLRKELR
ncbi:hypothetical protein Ancab_027903 [Ancistrocladus abbreviatus]